MLQTMHSSLLLWLLLATGVFWCVGVYNRLMRMRAHGLDTFGSVEKLLRNLEALVVQHMDAAGSVEAVSGAAAVDEQWAHWQDLRALLQSLEPACKGVRAEPLCPQPMAALTNLLAQVQAEWQRLLEEPADLAGSPIPQEFQVQWDDAALRLQMARSAFNQIVERYNEALLEFPARLIVGVLGFRKAGVL
jgi:LemA protein